MGVQTAFRPDLIVTSSDGTEMKLVVAVGRDQEDHKYVEGPLKRYIIATNCPVGLLVVPNGLWIYRNRYLANDRDSVQELGPFSKLWPPDSLPQPFPGFPAAAAAALDPFVQQVRNWLESLETRANLNALSQDLARSGQRLPASRAARGCLARRCSPTYSVVRHVFVETNWVVDLPHPHRSGCRMRSNCWRKREKVNFNFICLRYPWPKRNLPCGGYTRRERRAIRFASS